MFLTPVISSHSMRKSPYLSAGVMSARACVRATMERLNISRVEGGKDTSVGRWVQELAWRDFYTCILAAFPRVSMGLPFLEKYTEIKWEDESIDDALTRWEEGRTGVPIVDAGMRCLRQTGWMHNRLRMITAMFLCKDLMIDWRLGERVSVVLSALFHLTLTNPWASFSCGNLWMGTSHRTTVDGNGRRVRERTLARISGYSIRIRKVRKLILQASLLGDMFLNLETYVDRVRFYMIHGDSS
jgi:hypothetical protein